VRTFWSDQTEGIQQEYFNENVTLEPLIPDDILVGAQDIEADSTPKHMPSYQEPNTKSIINDLLENNDNYTDVQPADQNHHIDSDNANDNVNENQNDIHGDNDHNLSISEYLVNLKRSKKLPDYLFDNLDKSSKNKPANQNRDMKMINELKEQHPPDMVMDGKRNRSGNRIDRAED
jgi:hypothetical protein